MAKTDFNDGSNLTPAFMDSFHGTNAATGHAHDGLDADGSCPAVWDLGTVNVDVSSTYFTPAANFDWYWKKAQGSNIVHILIPDMKGVHATNDQFQISPNTTWPAALMPTSSFIYIPGVFLLMQDAVNGENRLGAIYLTNVNSANWVASINDTNAELDNNGFGTAGIVGQEKGIRAQTLTYYVD